MTGNGHDDVDMAMSRYIGAELAARLRTHPVFFSVPTLRMQHAGVRSYLSRVRLVISGGGTPWRQAVRTAHPTGRLATGCIHL